ncbi:hypothetical protein [Botrimarina mediterranea]|uniref:Uncharacterized protein n=1 Tax=Botrimarina mediterranea TaxID=2528022 RepID=A0A518KEZ4_9BACT|nr:hypothetical protein [Botrimarina mediterranea]QDV76352.1 hypothetical protein Spa11_45820 [Botrimarina mediterranea]QDV80950.1 hypothetical protein K2D_45850 [Planctomycetes bacterium K2D]
MQFHFAATVRAIVHLVVAPACLAATAITATALSTPALGAASEDAPAGEAAAESASPAVERRFDPAAMPEVGPAASPLGYHYAELTPAQTAALRRRFKLPLEALATVKSPSELKQAVVVAPLPDPNRPLLAVSPASESQKNPFADSDAISFRKDPLKALGAMLGAGDAMPAGAPAATADSEEDNPFGGAVAAEAPEPQAEVDGADDPFGADADPFGSDTGAEAADEEDPFGAF